MPKLSFQRGWSTPVLKRARCKRAELEEVCRFHVMEKWLALAYIRGRVSCRAGHQEMASCKSRPGSMSLSAIAIYDSMGYSVTDLVRGRGRGRGEELHGPVWSLESGVCSLPSVGTPSQLSRQSTHVVPPSFLRGRQVKVQRTQIAREYEVRYCT